MTSSPVTEWEQWAVVHHYVEKHGREAPVLIAMRADRLLEQGELMGARTYIAIMRKSEQLLRREQRNLH